MSWTSSILVSNTDNFYQLQSSCVIYYTYVFAAPLFDQKHEFYCILSILCFVTTSEVAMNCEESRGKAAKKAEVRT